MVLLKRIFRTMALAAFATVLVGLLSGEARAEPGRSWTLESQSGQVNLVKPGIAPISLTTGDVFASGDWIETGLDGRALLRRREETIVVAPNSRIGLPKNNNGPYATRILQTLGTILLTVEKKAARHFQVETPYLTAVVKGTTFTVGIQDDRTVVHVVEGLVEVKSLSSGRSSLVRPGLTGSVIRGRGDVEIGGGDIDSTEAGRASQVTVPAASQTSPVAVAAVSKSKSSKVRIVQALGPTTLDLSQSTGGLLRAARSGQGKALSRESKPAKKADFDKKLKANDKGSKLGESKKTASGLKGGAKAAKLGKSFSTAKPPSNLGSTALALNNSASAGLTGLGSSNGLDVGKKVGKTKGKTKGAGKSK